MIINYITFIENYNIYINAFPYLIMSCGRLTPVRIVCNPQ